MTMMAWDEIKTAYHVARIGTVSGAAEALGVHHATVIRHIDALEGTLGVKLFQRHPRGYTPTDAGRDLLHVAQATDDRFAQLVNRMKGQGDTVSGELIVTSLAEFSPTLTPFLVRFRERHPDLIIRSLTGERLYRLEYGEAHVAIRAGAKPEEPDNIAQRLGSETYALYAARSYAARHGLPQSEAELADHRFVGPDHDNARAPFFKWLNATIPPERRVFRATDSRVLRDAVLGGVGLGFLSVLQTRPEDDVVQVLPDVLTWTSPLWLVTHVDLHRSAKVQAFLGAIKDEAQHWPSSDPGLDPPGNRQENAE